MPRARTTHAVAASCFGALLWLAGCVVGPSFTKPEATVPASWSAKDDPQIVIEARPDALWWRAFNDPTLDQLVEVAYQQNLPLQVAGLRIVEARARLGVATGRQYPQLQTLSGSGSAVGLSESAANAAAIDDRNYWDFRLGFDAVWELDFWGKYRRGVEAEAAGLLTSVADYQSALVSLTAEVARVYVVIRTQEVLIEQALENVKIQGEGQKIAQSRFKNGATSELDVAQATTLLESTRASIPQLQIGLYQARNALSTLLGQPPGAVEALLAGPGQLPSPPARVVLSVPAELLRRRPDIRSAEMSAAAQSARIGVAKADLYPSFSLFGNLGLEASVGGAAAGGLSLPGSLAYSVGPRVVWPFFNYGRLKNNVRVEDARFQQLLVSYRDTVLRAAREVEDALAGYLSSRRALTFEQSSLKAAQRAVEIALVQYREGATDYQRVLDAQRSLLQQQNLVTQTSSSVITNIISLYKALGGGWELRQGEPIVPEPTLREMKQRTDWGDLLWQPRSVETATSPPPGNR
jgi:NodT family efflux transporter outer membrane factor (OMF) lipoprotein